MLTFKYSHSYSVDGVHLGYQDSEYLRHTLLFGIWSPLVLSNIIMPTYKINFNCTPSNRLDMTEWLLPFLQCWTTGPNLNYQLFCILADDRLDFCYAYYMVLYSTYVSFHAQPLFLLRLCILLLFLILPFSGFLYFWIYVVCVVWQSPDFLPASFLVFT